MRNKNFWLWLTAIFMVIAVVAVIISASGTFGASKEIKAEYNNGICQDCGGHYHLIVRTNASRYIYECDKCYRTLSSYWLLK